MASERYSALEARIAAGENLQGVLVATESIDILRRAYPNYFLDTRDLLGPTRLYVQGLWNISLELLRKAENPRQLVQIYGVFSILRIRNMLPQIVPYILQHA